LFIKSLSAFSMSKRQRPVSSLSADASQAVVIQAPPGSDTANIEGVDADALSLVASNFPWL
jgi:hypothetical protein